MKLYRSIYMHIATLPPLLVFQGGGVKDKDKGVVKSIVEHPPIILPPPTPPFFLEKGGSRSSYCTDTRCMA
jgi:hypothetical protein